MPVPTAELLGFFLILFRCSALIMTAPVFAAPAINTRVRLMASVVIAAAAWFGGDTPAYLGDVTTGHLAGAACSEMIIGAAGGLSARFLLEAARAAGSIAGLGMGMGFGSLVDPFTGTSGAPLAAVINWAGMAWAVELGLHQDAIVYVTSSVHAIGPGAAADLSAILREAIAHAIGAVILAIRLGTPLLSTVILGHVVIGVTGRVAPQLNVQSLGFSFAIAAGAWAVFLATDDVGRICADAARAPFL
jgi:flagellar biosynthetic protein FliR